MLANQNKIIIVDNMQSELDMLGKSFFINGIGCRTFLYTTDYDEEPLKNVRLAFFDINLNFSKETLSNQDIEEIKRNHTSVLNDIAYALKQFIHPDNGPYALIFWTKNSVLIDAIIDYMSDKSRGYSDIPSPIFISYLDKSEYNDGNITNLSDAVVELIMSNEKIKFLFDLEENSRIAGEKTLNRIYNIIPRVDTWGKNDTFFDDLDKILSYIASSTLGFEHAKNNPGRAIYEGLLPIINYEFLNNESSLNWSKILNQLSNATVKLNLISPHENIQYKVNSLYHIEEFDSQMKDTRGCVIEVNKNDPDILKSFNIIEYKSWFNDLIPIDDSALRRSLRNSSQLVAIEFSAACDYSNQKKRINKFVLGVIVEKFNIQQLNKDRKIDASYQLGDCCFYYNEKNYSIWLNLNFVFGSTPGDSRLGNILFVLKKEIMDMVGNKYASHISRIGITSF